MTTPLVGWGRSTWNNAAWNQGGTVDATGVSLTSSVNDVGLVLDIDVTLTGVSATTSTTIQIREGWNRGLNVSDANLTSFGWGNGAWGNGNNTVSVTGIGLTSSLGEESVTGTASITLPSVALTSSTGTAVATGIAIAPASGNQLTASLGTETVATDQNISVTGIGMTSSLGDETPAVTKTTGWNRDHDINTGAAIGWGNQQWGATGLSQALTGQALTSSLGTVSLTTTQILSPSGIGLTSSIGTFSVSGDSQVTVVAASEPELDIFVGTAVSTIGKTAFPTGNQLTTSLGTVLTSIEITGLGMTSSLGEETQETSYEAPSVSSTLSAGSPTISGSSTLTVTGVSATSNTGNLQGTFWSAVDDSNSAISWTEVNKAA
mgnify:FL=1|jgi:hypothetical protein|tara:strand:+ start:18 stop:1148 length:1131 start_codon:yes stop_codon:yes gene_type:complete